VIFRDEVRTPRRTIPIATYGVVALLAGMYALTAWCFVISYGPAAVMDALNKDLAGASTSSIQQYTGQFAYDAATIMLFTSSFALALAAHNITSRYLFNLGADGIFPQKLGEAHPRHVSPHRASIVVSIASFVTLTIFIIFKVPEGDLYARLAGLYSSAFVMLLVLVALAVGVFLRRDRDRGAANGSVAASLIAFAVFTVTLVLATKNFTLLTGAEGTAKTLLLGVIWGVSLAGVATALVLRRTRPEVYAQIGRQ
jgi:amino acid transporter